FEGQPVDLAGELERNVVAILDQRDPGARILADVESFVLRERDRGGVLHRIPSCLFTVHRQHAGTTFAQTRFVWLEIEHDGVLARCQLRSLPNRALEVEQIVEEHYSAAVEAKFALA